MDLLITILFGFALLAAAQAVLLVVKHRATKHHAELEWRRLSDRGDPRLQGVAHGEFVSLYRRVYGPRGQVYLLAALGAAAAATPVIVGLLAGVWHWGWTLSGTPRVYAPGNLVWQFYLFFGLIASWAGIASRFAERYHRRRPAEFDYELKRARAGLR